jgi:GTP-binding protein
LGVLSFGTGRDGYDSRDIIIADIPGLIEGASEGAGLGIRFLKHISRAAALIFLIDLSETNCSEAFKILYRELENFSPELVRKRRIICGSKLDLEGADEALEKLRAAYSDEKVLGISVFSGAGLTELAGEIGVLVDENRADDTTDENTESITDENTPGRNTAYETGGEEL